ncbi:MAG: hypothetical protein CSA97_04015 [Bacteroidetes bacterium]|nr:MAG: hypothetical protein CSA97_04015 [Bacteroidota bacterium]
METIDITPENFTMSAVAFIKHGQLYFYHRNNKGEDAKYHLTAEKDEALSCAFSPASQNLYYIVARGDDLILKLISWGNGDPLKPTEVYLLSLNRQQYLKNGFPRGLIVTEAEQVLIPYGNRKDPASLERVMLSDEVGLRNIDYSEYRNLLDAYLKKYRYTWRFVSSEETAEGIPIFASGDNYSQLMYKGKSLTSQLDLSTQGQELPEGYFYQDVVLNASEDKIIFCARTSQTDGVMHGPWCIANADGTNQRKLIADDLNVPLHPLFACGGMLVVFAQPSPNGKGFCLCTTNSEDNSIVRLEDGISYWATMDICMIP